MRTALLLLLAALMAGCTAEGDIDNTDNNVVLVVGAITQSSDPFGDMLTSGKTFPPDTIDVEFSVFPKSQTPPPGTPTELDLQQVVIERYEVTFQRTDGGSAVPPGFERGINLVVRVTPIGQQPRTSTILGLELVPSTSKTQPPLSFLVDPGFEPSTGFVNIQVRATIRFFGRTLAGDPVSATATVGINFADFGDDNP